MKQVSVILLIVLCSFSAIAQQDKEDRIEDRKEQQAEKKSVNRNKVDYNVFRRQILTLPEFGEQRNKLAEYKKAGKGIAKIYAVVDSLNDTEDSKTLTGYIQLVLGDNVANIYEVTYDRSLKKISQVKATGETLEIEKADKEEKQAPAKQTVKKAPKKKKSEDEEDEEEAEEEEEEKEEKPAKKKQKDEDD
jgi:hypothetical protein